MDIRDLRIFARVAAVQNLTSVAGTLGVSAGTISKRIQALEDELGVRLIDRTTRSSRLTEEGRMFLERAERVLAEMDLATDELAANSSQPAGRITISVPASLSRQLVAPAVVGFVNAFPGVEIRVDVSDHVVNLHEQGYDAAIRFGALSDSSLKAKRLVSDRIILAAAPAYLGREGTPRRAADIERHECLIHGEHRNWTLTRGETRTSVRASGRLVSDCGDFLLSAALQGAGILRTSEIAVLDALEAGRLVRVLPEMEAGADAAVWAVYPNAKHAMPRLRAFLDHVCAFCRERLSQVQRGGAGEAAAPLRTALADVGASAQRAPAG
jgi:DNA-binding transcriptional LysR family regulator